MGRWPQGSRVCSRRDSQAGRAVHEHPRGQRGGLWGWVDLWRGLVRASLQKRGSCELLSGVLLRGHDSRPLVSTDMRGTGLPRGPALRLLQPGSLHVRDGTWPQLPSVRVCRWPGVRGPPAGRSSGRSVDAVRDALRRTEAALYRRDRLPPVLLPEALRPRGTWRLRSWLQVWTIRGERSLGLPFRQAEDPLTNRGALTTARLASDDSFGGGFDCRRSQVEQPAAFNAPPSENRGGACIWGPNPVFGSRGGREARYCSGSSAPTARVCFRSPSRRVSPAARFLLASHRTGRADFPHPANVLFSNSAQCTRGVPCFIRSVLAAASIPALASSEPAWGTPVWNGLHDAPPRLHRVVILARQDSLCGKGASKRGPPWRLVPD